MAKAFRHADLDREGRLAGHFLWTEPAAARGLYGPRMTAHAADLDALRPLRETLVTLSPETGRWEF